MPNLDYYAILEIATGARADEIKKSYRRLAGKFHPDRNPGDAVAESRFKEIAEAFDVLSDPEKRAHYDRVHGIPTLATEPEPAGARPHRADAPKTDPRAQRARARSRPTPVVRFADIAADFFGDDAAAAPEPSLTRYRRPPIPGGNIEQEVAVDFETSITGGVVKVSVVRSVGCDSCDGTGFDESEPDEPCATCRGRAASDCRDCGGRGRRRPDCPACRGEGTRRSTEMLRGVSVPAGVVPGARIRVRGKGFAGRYGGPDGDLSLVVRVNSHPVFSRVGEHVLCSVAVSIVEAAFGATVEIPTLGGRARIRIPAGSQSGSRLRLRGQGAPTSDGGRGDLLVEILIKLPREIDEESRRLLEEFGRRNPHNPRAEQGQE